jgi:hypothetical protein
MQSRSPSVIDLNAELANLTMFRGAKAGVACL